ncbi:MAG: DUF488 domain-containing protein [Acidobacteria bacterium]|nr:DUF488 domain-containing protein [Acidobacteriota bacterium]
MSNEEPSSGFLFTVGHSTREWAEFVELLRTSNVERLVDVRTIPRSRHNPQFNRESMGPKLRRAGIGYVYLRNLGGLRKPRPDSINAGWRNASFRGYADYMQTPDFETALQRLIKLADEKRCAFMCAEAVPWRCHRSLIADALVARGFRVEHIVGSARRQLHSLTPFARVNAASVTYPAASDAQLELLPAEPARRKRA